jgi:acyl-CoA reductase-like NAD-dependent aldehyde dehydrogenase
MLHLRFPNADSPLDDNSDAAGQTIMNDSNQNAAPGLAAIRAALDSYFANRGHWPPHRRAQAEKELADLLAQLQRLAASLQIDLNAPADRARRAGHGKDGD